MNIPRIEYIDTKYLNAVAAVLFVGIIGTSAYGLLRLGPTAEEQSNLIGSQPVVAEEDFEPLQPVTQEQARSIARTKNPNVAIRKVETTTVGDGSVVHTIYFSDGTKVAVAADDGASSEPVPEAAPQVSPEPIAQPTETPTPEQVVPPENSEPPSEDEPQEQAGLTPEDIPTN